MLYDASDAFYKRACVRGVWKGRSPHFLGPIRDKAILLGIKVWGKIENTPLLVVHRSFHSKFGCELSCNTLGSEAWAFQTSM